MMIQNILKCYFSVHSSEIKTEDLSQDKDFSMSSETSSDSSDTDSNDDYK